LRNTPFGIENITFAMEMRKAISPVIGYYLFTLSANPCPDLEGG
jgi:hypothetical protein